MIKQKLIILLILFLALSCQERHKEINEEILMENSGEVEKENIYEAADKGLEKSVLILSANALQIMNEETGSTTDLLFGMELDQLVDIVDNTVDTKVQRVQVNTGCGAEPLKTASWENGLVAVFQENNINQKWEFSGWFVNQTRDTSQGLSTMSGIGIGSTRKALEEAYGVEVIQTTLGYEFSTEAGINGILSGPAENAKIETMWSGQTCTFDNL